MGVTVTDLADAGRSERVNWWNWRPTVELLRASTLFDDEQLIMFDLGVGEATADQARAFAHHLGAEVLPNVRPGGRVLLDGSATDVPDDGVFHRGPAERAKNYGATEEWLLRFAAFCRGCGGFGVG